MAPNNTVADRFHSENGKIDFYACRLAEAVFK